MGCAPCSLIALNRAVLREEWGDFCSVSVISKNGILREPTHNKAQKTKLLGAGSRRAVEEDDLETKSWGTAEKNNRKTKVAVGSSLSPNLHIYIYIYI